MSFFEKLFGSFSDKELKRINPIKDKVLALEPEMAKLTDEQLQAKTAEFKERLAKGETLDDILPEAFAVCREADWRVLADSLVWLCTFALASTATYTVLGRPWDCHYDAVWLVLCIAIMMPSAWLLQRIVPAEWAASTEKGVRCGAITAAMLFLWFVVFWFVDKWITPLLPAVGLPNLAAVILFGAALAVLLFWRNRRRNELAEKHPWRDVMEK